MRVRIVSKLTVNMPTGSGQYWERLKYCLHKAGIECDWVSLDGWLGGQVSGNPATDLLIVTNQDAGKIQPEYAVIAVQHGCAGEHLARIPTWQGGQGFMDAQARAGKRDRTFWVACSQWAAVHCKKHMGVMADRIIYGCVDTDKFIPSERQRLRDSSKPVVLHHCADPNKGSEIIGAVTRALGAAFDVRRLNVPPAQVAAAMRETDIWLCLSASEGLPTVVQEALSCGLIVVGPDIGVLWPYANGAPISSRQEGLCGWANPEVGSVVFPWKLRTNAEFVADMVRAAWACRGELHGRDYARQWWSAPLFTQKWLEAIALAVQRFAVVKAGAAPRAGAPKPAAPTRKPVPAPKPSAVFHRDHGR